MRHPLSIIASEFLSWELELHFASAEDDNGHVHDAYLPESRVSATQRDEDSRHATRSANILTRIIRDPTFAHRVKTLKIFLSRRDKDRSMPFQTGDFGLKFSNIFGG